MIASAAWAKSSVAVYGVGRQHTGIMREQVTLEIILRSGDRILKLSAIVLPRLMVYTRITNLAMRE